MDEFYEILDQRLGMEFYDVLSAEFWREYPQHELRLANEIGLTPNVRKGCNTRFGRQRTTAVTNDLMIHQFGDYDGGAESVYRVLARDQFRALLERQLLRREDKDLFLDSMPLDLCVYDDSQLSPAIKPNLREKQVAALRQLSKRNLDDVPEAISTQCDIQTAVWYWPLPEKKTPRLIADNPEMAAGYEQIQRVRHMADRIEPASRLALAFFQENWRKVSADFGHEGPRVIYMIRKYGRDDLERVMRGQPVQEW